jgi:N12 class adenine-specific DNA methylase
MGSRQGEIHLVSTGRSDQLDPPNNLRNYRISDADRVGQGSLREKYRNNIAAIKTLQQIESENRPVSAEEKAVLVKYTGWGGLPQVFNPLEGTDWQTERAELTGLLTPKEYESARATTLNAHYTAPVVIRGMYAALERFGFKHGRILEPACGLGHFIGLMPDEMHSRSAVTAIEIDPITARLAKALYPDADIRNQPFEEAALARDYYDVAISNVPFGDYKPFDAKLNSQGFLIHDYFFSAALERVRPDGLVMFITSKGTMDKGDPSIRKYLAERAELVGAIRLPNTAFKKNANTEVTTDILILRKLKSSEPSNGVPWIETTDFTNSKGEKMSINRYFAERPHMMLGEMRLAGRMYQRNEPTLVSDKRELSAALAEAITHLPEKIYQTAKQEVHAATAEQIVPAPDYIKPNAYAVVDDEIAIRVDDRLKKLPDLPAQTKLRIRGLIKVRDAARECLRTQMDGSNDETIAFARQKLNQTYDRFASRFGAISETGNFRAFKEDPDFPLLLSLEHYDEETKKATKAAIFRERTIHPRKPIEAADTPKAALIISLNEKGRVDLDYMGTLLSRSSDDFLPELKGVVFLNPENRAWETEDQYLSGNVREKLQIAESATLNESRFAENVEALKAVQPKDLAATEIDARLGACWIPQEDVQVYARELIQADDISVRHLQQRATWFVQGEWQAKRSVNNTNEWGTSRATALELLEDSLNLKTPTVYDTIRDSKGERTVVNAQETEAAREKQEKIKERFKEWIWQDDERRERLATKYNREFNSIRLRIFNGDHLTLPGASHTITLGKHQKSGAWRILQTPNTLLGHVVGAGKTFTMVAAGMELKRLGLARKPLFVVPNHMLGQFSSELLQLYPAANILVATKEDFEKTRRRQLMSRIATGNWDAIIVTHSGFEKIPLSKDTKESFFQEQLHELEQALIEEKAGKASRRLVKDLERAKKHLETKLKAMVADEKKDNTLTFEELGVDRLFVDEAQYFKNLFFISKMTRIAGLPQTASERAFDMFLKVRHLQNTNGGGVIFATGTPITNSIAEMYTMQRYLQMNSLRKQHIHHFDAWAATFGEPVTGMELSPDGAGYRLHTRFARFVNVPELMQLFRQVADIETAETLKLPVPEIQGGKAAVIRAPSTPELKELVAALVKRADAIRNREVRPDEDNMLKITTEGRKAALDLRILNRHATDHPDSKVNLAVQKIFEVWKSTSSDRSAQLVFCDLSTPSKFPNKFSVYTDIKKKLIQAGVPENEIAFIQDYDSDSQKHTLFKDVRSGKVRILMGSTQKMGAGTNVQERLVALHHLDAPWRPADVEQREGRILRQGNKNSAVQIYRYVTEGSFDAYMWQTLETKARFINQVMTGDTHVRQIEDIDSRALTYAEVKAIASGNPLVIEKANIDAQVMRLSRLRAQHHETQYRIRSEIRRLEGDISIFTERSRTLSEDTALRQDTRGDAFKISVEGKTFTDRGQAGDTILRLAAQMKEGRREQRIGDFAGFQLFLRSNFIGHCEVVVQGNSLHSANLSDSGLGTIRSLEYAVQNLEERLVKCRREIEDSQKRIDDLKVRVGQPFQHEEKLTVLSTRQQEIIAALDISKNQASSQLDSATEQIDEGISPKETSQVRNCASVSIKS